MEPASRPQMGRGQVRVTLTKGSPFVCPLDKFKYKNWESGFSVIEILLMVLLTVVISGISMIQLQPSLRQVAAREVSGGICRGPCSLLDSIISGDT